MEAGTVIKWNNFPFPKYDKEIKPRWFVCLGETGALSDVAQVYLCTTTTQAEAFKPGGIKARHTHCEFKASGPLAKLLN